MNKIVNPFAIVCLVLIFPTSKKVGDNGQDSRCGGHDVISQVTISI